jgi:putative hydroxymethylpyrimidine transporter CytX
VNVIQNLGWSTFELLIISSAAATLSDQVFDFRARWLWAVLFGAVSIGLGFLGPVGFVRRYVKKFAAWAVLASIVYLTWWVLDKSDLHAFWSAGGKGGLTFAGGVDLVIASVISWTPLAADYTRFARTRRGAFWGTSVGYFFPTLWCLGIGCLLALARNIGAPEEIPAAVAAGSAGILALLALTVDESDEAFADIYSTAVSIQNLVPQLPQRLLIVLVGGIATLGAIVMDLRNYQDFLFLLGSFFVPLFGVVLADWLLRGAHYGRREIFEGPAFRFELIGAWVIGFCLYQWLSPVGPSWWTDLVQHTSPGHAAWTASLPSFAAAFCLSALAGLVRRPKLGLARA